MPSNARPGSSKLNQCLLCEGTGILIRHTPSDTHKCGFKTEAYTCDRCLGSGRTLPPVPNRSEEKQ